MRSLGLALVLVLAGTGARAPEIRSTRWLNGTPPADLHGRTVLVEFWTFG